MTFIPALSVLTSVYQGTGYFPGFLENLRAQTLFPELELIIVLNEPDIAEKLVNEFSSRYPGQVQILRVDKVETLGASWNRAWAAARAPYLAIWNIDDRRVPDSLGRQLSKLKQNTDWVLCYGDYLAVPAYGKEVGSRRRTPPYSSSHFSRAFAQGGAFWVFRREVAEQAGYFDEQFEVAADMDLSLRMAAIGLQMGRGEDVLGYFTDAAQGLSTREGARQSIIERTAIQLRYGVFDKVERRYLKKASEYQLHSIKSFGVSHELENYLPNYQQYLRLRQPLWLLNLARNLIRFMLERVGLLGLTHRLQERIWKREI